jgi:uncharacterized protein YqgV (UPF0045/DUF77 family)
LAADAFSECKRLLARSGLAVHLRRRSAIIQGEWNAVTEAVRQCCEIVARTGVARLMTAIKPLSTTAAAAPQAETIEEAAETPAISLTAPRLHSTGAKAKHHRMSVA